MICKKCGEYSYAFENGVCLDCLKKKKTKDWKCLVCKEEINEGEMCKCMREYSQYHGGKS